MSIVSGNPNWLSGDDNSTKKTKETSVKKEPEFTDAKKLKVIESLLKKLNVLEAEVGDVYKIWPTSEMSTIGTLIGSIKFNIKKIKPTNE